MKETENKNQDTIEVFAQDENKKEIKMIGSQRRIKGLTLWEFNQITKVLKKAKFEKQLVELKHLPKKAEDLVIKSKVITNQNCTYFQALNIKNALKFLTKFNYKVEEIAVEL
jgi:hypothetical protein